MQHRDEFDHHQHSQRYDESDQVVTEKRNLDDTTTSVDI